MNLINVVFLILVSRGASGMVRNAPRKRPAATFSHTGRLLHVKPLQTATIAVKLTGGPSLQACLKITFKRYVALSEEKPFVTKSLAAAAVGGMGDFLSQVLKSVSTATYFKLDLSRTVTFIMIGLCCKGPLMHIWFKTLHRMGE